MKFSTLIYSIKQGFKNIKRNKLFSLASIGTIAACIFLIGLFYAILANFQHMVDEAEKNVCLEVFFDYEITQEQIDKIGDIIKKRAEVEKIEYTSPEEAWEKFKVDYFATSPELAEGFEDDNPLVNSASYTVYINDVTMHKLLKDYIGKIDGVREVKGSEKVADTLTDFGKIVSYISVAVIVVLLAVGLFLISNTVIIGIAARKEEIKIMKLIGATDFFVRVPFIIEGIIIGLIGACIPLIILFFIYKNVVVYMLEQFRTITTQATFLPLQSVFVVMIPMALIIGGGIGFTGSMITIRKYLKV